MKLVAYLNVELPLKLIDGDHIDGVPSHSLTDASTNLTADALVPSDPDGRDDRAGVIVRRFVVDAVHRAEGDTRLTAGTRVVDDRHEAGPLLLGGLFVVVGDILVQGALPLLLPTLVPYHNPVSRVKGGAQRLALQAIWCYVRVPNLVFDHHCHNRRGSRGIPDPAMSLEDLLSLF